VGPDLGLRSGNEAALAIVCEVVEPMVSPVAVGLPADAASLVGLDRFSAAPAVLDV
jgi:hypothetical protein